MRGERIQADWASVKLSLLSRTVATISIVIAGAQARIRMYIPRTQCKTFRQCATVGIHINGVTQ